MDAAERERIVMRTSVLGVAANLVLAGVKIAVGTAVSSIAIVSEAVNNAADSATSLLTMVGTKLASRHPTKKHPFGYGRIEYMTGLIVAGLILFTGLEFLKNSVEALFEPSEFDVSPAAVAVLLVSAVVKLVLAAHTVAMGKKAGSDALVGVGLECRGDSIVSAVTILSAVVFLVRGVSVDAWAGAAVSLFIVKAGAELLSQTVGSLLGEPADRGLADEIYRLVRANPIVVNAADLTLHNYGPGRFSGSVNVEVDHAKTVAEVYAEIHRLQLDVMHEKGVTMVFGVYAVDRDGAESAALRNLVAAFVREREHVLSYHAVYVDDAEKKIYCDLVVDYELRDWEALRREFAALMAEHYPDRELELVVETEFV